MAFPMRLTVSSFAYALDCGTTRLWATDEAGRDHTVMLVQHAFPQASPSLGAIPGRLYFDGELVPMRTELETRLLSLLRAAEVHYSPARAPCGKRIELSSNMHIIGDDIRQVLTRGPEENIRALLDKVVRFVESDEYLAFATRVEQAVDPTRYDVWVAWEPENRTQVIVRLGTMLGIGVPAARQLVESDEPIAKGITALEVSRLGEQYRQSGLGIRAQPQFRWPLA